MLGSASGANGRAKLIEDLKKVISNKQVRTTVKKRILEFKELGSSPSEEVFKELCFCILTANFSAEKGLLIQKEIGDGFLNYSEEELANRLRALGHRYPEIRARYIVNARKYSTNLKDIVRSFKDVKNLREWLVKNIKGIGYKEASHFLRNIGFEEVSIIDFHIINLLTKYSLIAKPKTLTKRRYLEIEKILSEIAKELNLSLGELDLYLWYMETGKILK